MIFERVGNSLHQFNGFKTFLLSLLLQNIDDDGDKKIQHGERGDKDKRHKQSSGISVGLHKRPNDPHPVIHCHNLEQGIHGVTDTAEPFRVVLSKQVGGDHRKIIKDQQQYHNGS